MTLCSMEGGRRVNVFVTLSMKAKLNRQFSVTERERRKAEKISRISVTSLVDDPLCNLGIAPMFNVYQAGIQGHLNL